MKRLFCIVHLLVFKLVIFSECYAQTTNQSKPGDVIINASYNNEKFTAKSKELRCFIDYTTSEIEFDLDPNTIISSIDTANVCFKSNESEELNECLRRSDIQPATLKGKPDVSFTIKDISAESNLKFEAEFQLNGITKLEYVTGTLKPLSSNDLISALLTLNFNFKLSEFGITTPTGFSDLLEVRIIQVVLTNEGVVLKDEKTNEKK
jgi:hypothetical protein